MASGSFSRPKVVLLLRSVWLCIEVSEDRLEIGMATTVVATRRRALMNIEQAADRLGVSMRDIRRLVGERRIPYLKWGHLFRFDHKDIDEWLEGHVVPVTRLGQR
jgi:excisionase family DNA binding protein